MITKNDAIKMGKAVCDTARRISADNGEEKMRLMGRGTCIYVLDNLWYDVLPNKVKEQFLYSKDAYYEACGWPN